MLVEIGDKGSKPLLEAIREGKIKDFVKGPLEGALRWLTWETPKRLPQVGTTPMAQETVCSLVEVKLKEKPIEYPEEQSTVTYLNPLVDWLYSDHKKTLKESLPEGLDEDIVDVVLEEILSTLIKKKVDDYFELWETEMGNKLKEIVLEFLSANSSRMARILGYRVAQLIDQLDTPKVFDEVIQTAHGQTGGVIFAREHFLEHKRLVKKNNALLKSKTATKEEKKEAQTYLANRKKLGLKELFHREFARKCKGVKDPAKISFPDGFDKKTYESMAKQLSELLLAPQVVNGKRIDGLQLLWSEVNFPEKVRDLRRHGQELIKAFFFPQVWLPSSPIKSP